ncbi:unnamed protein product [Pleuronectes platessa]|uniref:Uncharacterized protein n=1 Tax=Pleuronectes platessa TaxID=8262 RepID=A0A9N7YG19_PLEPL|nr:unnamed protein product [Pleuronectes platessa]
MTDKQYCYISTPMDNVTVTALRLDARGRQPFIKHKDTLWRIQPSQPSVLHSSNQLLLLLVSFGGKDTRTWFFTQMSWSMCRFTVGVSVKGAFFSRLSFRVRLMVMEEVWRGRSGEVSSVFICSAEAFITPTETMGIAEMSDETATSEQGRHGSSFFHWLLCVPLPSCQPTQDGDRTIPASWSWMQRNLSGEEGVRAKGGVCSRWNSSSEPPCCSN